MARDYELGIVVNPDVGDEQARAIVERITQVIATLEGQVVRVNAVGRRRLAYPIEHHRDGLYFYFDLMLAPQSIAEIERTIRVNEDIIRHLLLVRDSRVVEQQRQREAEALAQAQVQAAQAAERAAVAQVAAQVAATSEAGELTEAAEETPAPVTPVVAVAAADNIVDTDEIEEPEAAADQTDETVAAADADETEGAGEAEETEAEANV